jgi:hypothetical protein
MIRSEGLKVAEVMAEVAHGRPIQANARQTLIGAIRCLTLSGHGQTHARLGALSQKGVKYVALLLAEESAEQNERLSKLAADLKQERMNGN